MSRTPRTCPTCSSTLDVVVHEGVELDRCPGGHGLWLDRGELREVVMSEVVDRSDAAEREACATAARDHGQGLLAEVARGPRSCAVCGETMRITEYASSGVAIDECGRHGAWLDDGELERIEAYAEGLRTQATGGAAADAERVGALAVSGIQLPAELLRTIRTANVPPPG